MAKGKGKGSSGASEAVPETSASVSQPQATPSVPEFDDSAFAGLRQKIEQRLNNQNSGKGKSKQTEKTKPTEKTPTKKEKEAAPKPGKKQDSGQGKKRDRNGEVIARDEKKSGHKTQEQPKKKDGEKKQEKPKKGGKDDETLRQEILALGGTEDDLNLLAGVESESEVEGEAKKGKGSDEDLRKEMSKMLEAAGHVVPDDLEDDEAEAEEEAAEDEIEEDAQDDFSDEDAQDSEPEDVSDISDIEEAPKASATKAKGTDAAIPKEYANLVSSTTVYLNGPY